MDSSKIEEFPAEKRHGGRSHSDADVLLPHRSFTFYNRNAAAGISSSIIANKAENYLSSLADVSYNVTKLLSFKRSKPRVLRLTRTGIENVRKDKASSAHSYDSILSVKMKDVNLFSIQYEDAEHDYVYKSSAAMEIVQEISCRLSLKRATEKKKLQVETFIEEKKQLRRGDADKFLSLDDTATNRRQSKTIRLISIDATSEEKRVELAVDKILKNSSTAEAKMASEFMKSIHILQRSQTTLCMNVRQFLDGLKEYIILNRKDELATAYLGELARETTFINYDSMDLSGCIEKSIQKHVILPLYDRIYGAVRFTTGDADEILNRRIPRLQTKTLSFFDVKPEMETMNFDKASRELEMIYSYKLPYEKLSVILEAAKAIYTTVQEANASSVGGQKVLYLSADDFLPVFIYVVSRCNNFENSEAQAEYLWNLCDPEQLSGEAGYYLTAFVSCLSYIKNVKGELLLD